ncbi:hypothetical protein H4R33_003852 [Dimargaris cristalligena]|nr:hypothetical protein H4R33_003852 [Dimargaris cristalligena]
MPPPPPTPIPTVALFHGLAYITYAYYTLVITTALALLPLLSVRQLLLHGKTRSDEAKPPARETHSVIHRFWSRFQRCTVPKHWFAHFYLVGAVWNASLICIILKYFALSSNAANIDDGSPMYYVSGLAKWLSAEFQWTFTVAPPPPPGSLPNGLTHSLFWDWLSNAVAIGLDYAAVLTTGSVPTPILQRLDIAALSVPTVSVILLLLFQIHLMRRVMECYFMQRPSNSQMHIGHYLLGLSFYIVTVPTLLLDTLRLTLWDASMPALTATTSPFPPPLPDSFGSQAVRMLYPLLAFFLYGVASYHQSRCHYILAQLRTPSEPVAPTAPKEVRKGKRPQFPQSALTETHGKSSVDANKGRSTSAVYRIPAGDWFTGIECPHYYAEILIYLSLTFMAVPWLATTVEPATENFTQLAASPSTSVMTLSPAAAMPEHLVSYLWRLTTPKPGLGLLLLNTWNLVNLGISAWSTHVWYQRKFKSAFPTGRWILIPYVF